MIIGASNRQKKVLRLFCIQFEDTISAGAAGWEIGRIFSNPDNRDRWGKYVYLTNDFDSDSSSLRTFDVAALETCSLPDNWSSSRMEGAVREEIAAQILDGESPFDLPQPAVVIERRTFLFTGKFDFGTRKKCERAVLDLGGLIPPDDGVSTFVDYLVVGTKGSPYWSSGTYGRKIESAVVLRRNHGKPAIVSEDHWRSHLSLLGSV